MRDFPLFPTEFGVVSLVLKEIPYRQEAYITVHQVLPGALEDLLKECVSFCRMAGAEKIYAKGTEELERFPLYCGVLKMQGTAWVDQQNLENLFPVTEATVRRWREIYNERMGSIDNAGTLDSKDEKKILESGGAYFIHHAGELLGIGWMEDTKLLALASAKQGGGERTMHTLMSLVEGAQMTLEVASTNARAIAFYERLGFLVTGEVSRWYQVL